MMIFRIAKENDIAGILEIYRPYILNTAVSFEYEVPALDEFSLRFTKITRKFPWLVCEVDGVLAGYAYASLAFERAAYQWDAGISVYIHEKYHRLGIGNSFYHYIEQLLTLQGYCKLYACVTGGNETSHLFHEKMGFSNIGVFRRCGYKFNQWHDVIWYEKILSPVSSPPPPTAPFHTLEDSKVFKILKT